MSSHRPDTLYATTIVSVRRNGRIVVGGDGQVTLGNIVGGSLLVALVYYFVYRRSPDR